MEYGPSDSSGTDDDLPPSHRNRGASGGRITGNGRNVVGAHPYPRVQNDMETQIHQIEQEAYTSVLRAFKAQSDAITWEKESLITELRKELRVSDEEHRELLSIVNADDIIWRIREWRRTSGAQSGLFNNAQPAHDQAPSPTLSAYLKRKTSQLIPSLSLSTPSPVVHTLPFANSTQPSSSAAKKEAAPGVKGKKQKSGQSLPGASSMKSLQYPLTGLSGRALVPNKSSAGAHAATETALAAPFDHLIGRKVMTRWPEDNNFYEAVITDYNATEGIHLLVYDINTNNETWEWVNLKEISSEDIRWEGEDPGISRKVVGRGAPGRGAKKPTGRGGVIPGAGRGRGSLKNQFKKDFAPSQYGIGKNFGDIEILHTDTLIREVERIFNASHPDPLEIEKAKKALKDQEQALIDAIARLANASGGQSEDGEHNFSYSDQGWKNQHGANYDNNIVGEGRQGSNGGHMVGNAVASNYRHDDDDDITNQGK